MLRPSSTTSVAPARRHRPVPQTAAEGLNPAEEWVVAQVTAGEIADLSKKFPKEKDRKLRADFLEDLLMGTLPGVKLHRNGVRIIGATIDEPIDFTNAQTPCEVWLILCQFNKNVTFNSASFAGNVSFQNSAFKAEANFNSMKFGHTVFFIKAVFEGLVNFGAADIANTFDADEAQFKNKEQGANFNNLKVGHNAFFRKTVFEGPVDFVAADIANTFAADDAQFKNKEEGAFFNRMKVGGATSFQKAIFDGPVHFDSMKARGDAFFSDAVFQGLVSFDYAEFAWLDVSSAFWPKVATQFYTQGVSYKYIRAVKDNEPESHKALLKLADQSAYTADVYRNLEEFFLRQGYRGDADRAFIAGSGANEKKILTAWAGLAVTYSIGSSAMGVVRGRLAFPAQFWSH
jgi:hypothetical protein